MYLSLSEIDMAVARHRELVALAERARFLHGVPRPGSRFGAGRVRRTAGAALVRVGERLQGCPVPCGPEPVC
jgi:hypothetical protein